MTELVHNDQLPPPKAFPLITSTMVTEVKAASLPTQDAYPPPADVDVRGTAEAFLAQLADALKGDAEAFAGLFIPEGFWRDVLAFTRDFRTTEAASVAEVAKVSPPHARADPRTLSRRTRRRRSRCLPTRRPRSRARSPTSPGSASTSPLRRRSASVLALRASCTPAARGAPTRSTPCSRRCMGGRRLWAATARMGGTTTASPTMPAARARPTSRTRTLRCSSVGLVALIKLTSSRWRAQRPRLLGRSPLVRRDLPRGGQV